MAFCGFHGLHPDASYARLRQKSVELHKLRTCFVRHCQHECSKLSIHLEVMLGRKGVAALKRKLASLEVLLDDDGDEDRPDEGEPDTEALNEAGLTTGPYYVRTPMLDQPSQLDKFKAFARDLEADEAEGR